MTGTCSYSAGRQLGKLSGGILTGIGASIFLVACLSREQSYVPPPDDKHISIGDTTAAEGISRRYTEAQAIALASGQLEKLSRSSVLPSFLRPVGKCEMFCVSPDRTPPPACSAWRCHFIYADPAHPKPYFLFSVLLDGFSNIGISAEIERCLNAAHKCRMSISYEMALQRLGSDPAALAIVWDDVSREFYWEDSDSGRRISCHGTTIGEETTN